MFSNVHAAEIAGPPRPKALTVTPVPTATPKPTVTPESAATPEPTATPEPKATPEPESPQIPAATVTPAAESAAADPEQEVSQAGGQAMEQQRAGKAWLVTGGIILCMGIAAGGFWLHHHIVQEKRKNDEG